MNWVRTKYPKLWMGSWFYWNLAFPVTLRQAIRDQRGRRAEKKALSVSLVLILRGPG